MTNHEQPDRVEHRMERTYEVTATPEQVWNAIATADGISAWMVPTRLDPQIGGEVSFDLGGFRSTGVVTDYTPNHRFAYEEPWPIADRVEDIPAEMVEWFNTIGVPLSDVYRDLPSVTPIATAFLAIPLGAITIVLLRWMAWTQALIATSLLGPRRLAVR